MKPDLPAPLQDIDVSDYAAVEPRGLILNPVRVAADTLAAGRAMVYARSGDQTSYDAIGFKTFAATPRRGPTPLQTSAWSAMQRSLDDDHKADTLVDEILNLAPKLQHRPLALPKEGEDYRFEGERDLIHLYRRTTDPAGRKVEDRWTFSLTDPPEVLLTGALDGDEPLIAAQRLQVDLQGTHWLPYPALLAEGRFRKLQEIRPLLERQTRPGAFYCFVSHRWLDPHHPDPEARQARFVAWQLLAYLAEAVRVAHQRGLHQPRRFSPRLGTALGPRGTELAESLIVNVLRFTLDPGTLSDAAAEVSSLEAMLEDYGIARAATDEGLQELRAVFAERPVLRSLTDNLYLWYDFSCLPQPPREGDDIDLFATGLRELSAAQVIGRTSIMLDDADDYLSRAWCTLEALVADTHGGATDLLVGSARPSTAEGAVEHYFETLLQDRPHMVWRAVLDTELFAVQNSATCMNRLGLDVTDPSDEPFTYERLSGLGAPGKIHIDDSEIVTGALALPAFENHTIMVRARSGRSITPEAVPPPTATLDWTDALSLADWHGTGNSADAIPPYLRVSGAEGTDAPSCHIAVVGASEGEAILLAAWAYRKRAELESLLSVSVSAVSWIATDIAPVGHIAVGSLEVLPITADTWAIVTSSTRLKHCNVTGLITESLRWAGVSHAAVAIDESEDNVAIEGPAELPEGVELSELAVAINLVEHPPRTHPGGLFRWQIAEELV